MSGTGKEYGELMKEIRMVNEPQRVAYAANKIRVLGFEPKYNEGNKCLEIIFNNELVLFYPWTGWATGKSIKDGRGLNHLIKQLKSNDNRN